MNKLAFFGIFPLCSAISLGATTFYKNKIEEEKERLFLENLGLYKCVIFEKSLDECVKNIEKISTAKSLDEKIELLNLASYSINQAFSNGVFSINDANLNDKVEQSLLKLRISIIKKYNEETQSKNYLNSLTTALEVKNHYSINFFKEDRHAIDNYFKNSIKLRKAEESCISYFIMFTVTTPMFLFFLANDLYKYISKYWKKEDN